jgi:hypothetical protein
MLEHDRTIKLSVCVQTRFCFGCQLNMLIWSCQGTEWDVAGATQNSDSRKPFTVWLHLITALAAGKSTEVVA